MGIRYTGSLPTPNVTSAWGTPLNDAVDDIDEAFDENDTTDAGTGHSHNGTDGEGPKLRPAALHTHSGTGLVVAGASAFTPARTIVAGTGITVVNGDGVAGNPTVSSNPVTLNSYTIAEITTSVSTTLDVTVASYFNVTVDTLGPTLVFTAPADATKAMEVIVETSNGTGTSFNWAGTGMTIDWQNGTPTVPNTGRRFWRFIAYKNTYWIGQMVASNIS